MKVISYINDHDFGRFIGPVKMQRVSSIEELKDGLESDCIPIISSDFTSGNDMLTKKIHEMMLSNPSIIFYFMWNKDPNHSVTENDVLLRCLDNAEMDQNLPELPKI